MTPEIPRDDRIKKRVAALVHPFKAQRTRHENLEEEAERTIQPFLWPFRSVLGDMLTPFQFAGFPEAHINDVKKGNAFFGRERVTERGMSMESA